MKGDLLDEVDETMELELLKRRRTPSYERGGTIQNDDDDSKIAISDATWDEPGTMKFTVTLSQASERAVKVSGRPPTARPLPAATTRAGAGR